VLQLQFVLQRTLLSALFSLHFSPQDGTYSNLNPKPEL